MRYDTEYYYVQRYEYVNSNQHGARYKRATSAKLREATLSCERTNADALEDLIILGHELDVPVHYDFKTNRAYIRIMSGEAVRRAI